MNQIGIMFGDPEKEAERRFEKYVAHPLEWLGDQISAKALNLTIWDNQHEGKILNVLASRNQMGWKFEVDESDLSYRRPAERARFKPSFTLKSQYCYELELPQRWFGMLAIEYPGITILSQENDRFIKQTLENISKDLTIMLFAEEGARLEKCLNEERKLTDEMRAFVVTLSKELYCVSSISNALVQSFNVEEVLARVLEQMLPFLGGKIGVIYYPETGQCISFYAPRSRQERKEAPWFMSYFQAKMRLGNESLESNSFHLRRVAEHSRLPLQLKAHLATQHIDAVMEFALRYCSEYIGFGLIGFQENQHHPDSTRLLMIALNMIGLFLEHIALMKSLEHQVKLISQENLEIEKRNRFLLDHVSRHSPADRRGNRRVSPTDYLLDEIDRSRNTALLAEIASGVAHNLRNPLNNLLYALHLLNQENITDQEKKGIIESATERVEIINRTITQFIQYTRIPDLKLNVESINDVLQNALRSFKGWMDLQKIELETYFDPQLPTTRIDIFLINHAFHNILKNAMEAMSDHGHLRVATRKLKLRHGPEPRLEFAEIVFEDDGQGIVPDDLDKVLKPFYSRKEDGLGLGLATADHIIRTHGGAINLENRPEGGTRVNIYLPIR